MIRSVFSGELTYIRTQWTRTVILRRCFASSKWQQRDEGPPQIKLRAIPFTQHIKAAETVFNDYHGNGFFSVGIRNTGPPEETFLPFWVVSAKAHVQLKQAQVGRNTIQHHFNPATKRMEQVYTTEWAWVPSPEQYTFTRQYSPESHVDLQVYGSYKYRRGLVNGIRQTHVANVQPFTADLMDRPNYSDMGEEIRNIQRRIDPFTIYPTTALRLARSYIQSSEEREMDNILCNAYAADKTRLVDIEIKITDIHVSPVYYPAYVFTVNYLNRNLRTFVNGNSLSVSGMRAYNWRRAAACSALGMTALTMANGGIGWGGYSGSFWIGIVLPSLATAVMVMYYPLISLRVQDVIRQREVKSQLHDQKIWDAEWTEAYDSFESEQRYRAWHSEKQSYQKRRTRYSSSDSTATGADPKGYYAVLNVPTNASKSDIQGAFRGLAMKYHPDRYTDPKDKKAAKEKFQVISNAYSVLRDSKKRTIYDRTGGG